MLNDKLIGEISAYKNAYYKILFKFNPINEKCIVSYLQNTTLSLLKDDIEIEIKKL